MREWSSTRYRSLVDQISPLTVEEMVNVGLDPIPHIDYAE